MPIPMRMIFSAAALSAAVFCTPPSTAATLPATTDWHAAALQDIRFAIDSIRNSHAGTASAQLNVTVPLNANARAALAEADTVHTQQDYRRLLVRFISSFGDPHTGINLHLQTQGWTGLVLDRVDGQYRVIWSEPNWPQPLPPRGAVVQSCDNVWIGTYLQGSVAPFVNHSIEYPTTFSQLARLAMFDTGLGWTPTQCIFTLADGSRQRYDLHLRTVPDAVSEERIAAVRRQYDAKAKPVGLYPLGADKHWIGMPNFNGRTSGTAYEQLYRDMAALPASGWVVFDLRGNGGGDSSWGSRALAVLYGASYAGQLGDAPAYAKYLIADQPTIDLYQRFATLPEYAASRGEFEQALTQLKKALGAGERMAQLEATTQSDSEANLARVRVRPRGPRIAAVIDRGCFSSCMNFLQQISAIGDTVVLGEPTLGYSPYGEINRFDLPSGNGAIYVPSAVYSSFQATREPFVPDIPYAGNLADDDALMTWVDKTLSGLKPGQKQP
jgi:hypothetical protein